LNEEVVSLLIIINFASIGKNLNIVNLFKFIVLSFFFNCYLYRAINNLFSYFKTIIVLSMKLNEILFYVIGGCRLLRVFVKF